MVAHTCVNMSLSWQLESAFFPLPQSAIISGQISISCSLHLFVYLHLFCVTMHVLTRTQPSAPCVHAPGRDWWTNVVALASPAVSPPSWVTQDDFFFTLGLSVRQNRTSHTSVIGLGFVLSTVYPPNVAACPDGFKHSI
jgi:hypothetical protein